MGLFRRRSSEKASELARKEADQAASLVTQQRFLPAVTRFNTAILFCRKEGKHLEAARHGLRAGQSFFIAGREYEALRYFDDALLDFGRVARGEGSDDIDQKDRARAARLGEAMCLSFRGLSQSSLGEYEDGIASLQASRKAYETEGDSSRVTAATYLLAKTSRDWGLEEDDARILEQSRTYFEQASEAYARSGEDLGLAQVYLDSGPVLKALGAWEALVQGYSEARKRLADAGFHDQAQECETLYQEALAARRSNTNT